MENASKALIIAGAILLSIAIIGIGMYVYSTASETIGQADMSQQEVTAFNAPFTKYGGANVPGTSVRAMCDAVREHNAQVGDDESRQITIDGSAGTGTPGTANQSSFDTVKANVKAGIRYKVTFTYSTTGLIQKITIAE